MIDYDDLRLALAALDRYSDVTPAARAAANRLRDVIEPRLGDEATLDDPTRLATARRRRPSSPTSDAAAYAVLPKSGTQRMRVLAALWNAGEDGLTDAELAERTGIYLYSAAPRRVELVKGGWIIPANRTRPGPRGNDLAVWTVSADGRRRYPHVADASGRYGAA